jgi:hypothetical protein
MKFKGKVAYRGWSSGPAWGTDKEVALTLSNIEFHNRRQK